MEQNSRDYRFDLLRVIAASLIVLRHSPIPGSAPGVVLAGISYLTEPGVGLFFMISGALLLQNRLPVKAFLKRRLSKVLFPTLFWSVFYLLIKYVETPSTLADSTKMVLSIPFSAQGHGILWFMYTLVGLYLLTPILSRWLDSASKREVEFYLLLWGVTLLYPYLNQVLFINETTTGILYNFAGYSGYFLFGYYLKRYYSYRQVHVFVAAIIVILVPAILHFALREFDYYTMLDYLTLPAVSMTFCWFALINNKLQNKSNAIINEISKVSFGIYLIHIFIMRSIIWKLSIIEGLPGLLQIPIVAISTFFISFGICWLISRLPFSKYIIGV